MKKDGYITVYLSLMIVLMLSFIIALTEGIRVQTIRFQTECVMDIGITSIFAEYHRELLEQYGLFAIDMSYGSSSAEEENVKSRLLQYMNMNFIAPGQNRISNYKDLTAVHADNAQLSKITYLSDERGEVLRYQILQYMKEQTGLSYVEDILEPESFLQNDEKYQSLEKKKSNSYERIRNILKSLNDCRQPEEGEISIENPAERVEEMKSSFLLDLAVKDSEKLLYNKVTLSRYLSHRDYVEGAGLWEEQLSPQKVGNRQLLRQYLFEKCGYFNALKKNSSLGYQLEYLLYGNSDDTENLNDMAKQLLKVRYVINAAYLFENSAKTNEAAALAATVTTGIGSPQLTEAVKTTILFAWCYAESVQDLRILFDGNNVAGTKSDSTWNVSLNELLQFSATLDSYYSPQKGVSYSDYLSDFLLEKDESVLLMRLMDIMEMDIQKILGNQGFQMDSCIYQLKANVNVSSKYGYGYSIAREYSYE